MSVKTEVVFMLQSNGKLLEELKLPGVGEARSRVLAADEQHLEMTTGSWHRELDTACDDLRLALGDNPVAVIANAQLLGIRLPELPKLRSLAEAVKKSWSQRPGVLKAGKGV